VAGGQGDLLISRDAHKSVVAGLVFSGVEPQWIRPRYDTRLHVAYPPSPEQVEQAWQKHPDAAACADMLMTTSPNAMVYAPLDGKETHDVHAQFAQSSFPQEGAWVWG
jgi:arginine/lysine/ornithine decarboxylase